VDWVAFVWNNNRPTCASATIARSNSARGIRASTRGTDKAETRARARAKQHSIPSPKQEDTLRFAIN